MKDAAGTSSLNTLIHLMQCIGWTEVDRKEWIREWSCVKLCIMAVEHFGFYQFSFSGANSVEQDEIFIETWSDDEWICPQQLREGEQRDRLFALCSSHARLTSKTTREALTSFSLRTQGFCALRKPSSASLVSLKPPIICLWKASFCQLRILSLSSPDNRSRSSRWSSVSRSAACIKACHAFSRVPYWGPKAQVWTETLLHTAGKKHSRTKHVCQFSGDILECVGALWMEWTHTNIIIQMQSWVFHDLKYTL